MADSEGSGNSSARVPIIVALIGLVGVLATALISNWNKVFPTSISAPAPTKSSLQTSPKNRAIYSSGEVVVRGTRSCNLDLGAESTAKADFLWEQDTPIKRFLTPSNGAAFFVVGIRDFNPLSYSELEHFPYSAQKIDASDASSNNIPTNTVVAYRTSEGRLGKFLIVNYGYNLTIRWVTYQL